MIKKETIQKIADAYGVEVLDVQTLHDCTKIGCLADYIKLKIRKNLTDHQIYIYLKDDYHIVTDKNFYLECRINNAFYNEL